MLAHRIRYHCNYAMGKYKYKCARACVHACVPTYVLAYSYACVHICMYSGRYLGFLADCTLLRTHMTCALLEPLAG